MKLLFAIKSLNHASGGAEKVLADVTAMFASNNHQVSIITFDAEGGESFYPLHADIKRINLGIGSPQKRTSLRAFITRMFALRRIVKAQKPDAVIAFMHSMFIPISLALIGTNTRVIASEHIVPEYYKTRKIEFALFALCSFLLRDITVLSQSVRALYPVFIAKKMSVIPNPVAKASGGSARKSERKILLNVGRLEDQKDQASLISAFAGIAADFPNWDLRIIGDGSLRADLAAHISALNLNSRVTLVGITRNIESEYRKADLFVMSSHFEAFGLATAEAMSYAVPAVGFKDCAGTNEVILHDDNGLLVEGEDRVAALAAGLRELMGSDDLRAKMGANALKSVDRYSDVSVYQAWEKLLDLTQQGK